MSNIMPNSFIVISDFHSIKWPYEKIINEYINQYDKIYILGDATDRGKDGIGTNGLDLLFDIKDLTEKYPNRVFYLPGNHDDFVYMTLMMNSQNARHHMIINGGEKTLEDIDYLRKNMPDEANRLKDWLGKQPLQRIHEYNGKKYALAHALFDKKVYMNDKDFSLEKLNFATTEEEYKRCQNMIWFRKLNDKYELDAPPSSDYTMIIGHTPQSLEHPNNLNLKNEFGKIVKVVCVDGGINHTNRMLAFDGQLKIVSKETRIKQGKTREKKLDAQTLETFKEAFDEVIINSLQTKGTAYSIIDAVINKNFDNLTDDEKVLKNAKIIANNAIRQIAGNIAAEKPEYLEGTKKITVLLRNYIYEVVLNHIIESLAIRYGSYNRAGEQINVYLATNEPTYITQKVGKARTVANKIGIRNLEKILKLNSCLSVEDYIVSEFNRKSKTKMIDQ